jgi:hypothetical protein
LDFMSGPDAPAPPPRASPAGAGEAAEVAASECPAPEAPTPPPDGVAPAEALGSSTSRSTTVEAHGTARPR